MRFRLKEFMDVKGLNARELSARIGVQASSVSHILNGRNKPSLDFIEKLIKSFPDADISYLITGIRQAAKKQVQSDSPLPEHSEKNREKDHVKEVSSAKITNVMATDDVVEIIKFYQNGTFEIYKPKMS